MSIKSIYVNLPVRDISKTRSFWTNIGFAFNEQFSNEKGLCLILNEGSMYAMLLSDEFFSTFTDRPVADGKTTEVILAIEVGARAEVDRILAAAIDNGATRYKESIDHGWMYYDSFTDLDGHHWEVMHLDPSKMPAQ
jgi:hypothetical protein